MRNLKDKCGLTMHRLSSNRSVRNLRLAAISFLIFAPIAAAVPALLVISFVESDREWAIRALQVAGAAIVSYIIYGLFASGVRCPLCHVHVIARNRCSINHKAKRALGSHRLRVVFGVLCLNHFRCPYCGESTEVRARERGDPPRKRH